MNKDLIIGLVFSLSVHLLALNPFSGKNAPPKREAVVKEEIIQMVDLMTRRLEGQLQGQGLGLELTTAAKAHLANKGYDPTMGARPLRRAIQRLVEDPLSEHILTKFFHSGQIIVVDVEPDPENPSDQKITFRAVEALLPPPSPDLAQAGPTE